MSDTFGSSHTFWSLSYLREYLRVLNWAGHVSCNNLRTSEYFRPVFFLYSADKNNSICAGVKLFCKHVLSAVNNWADGAPLGATGLPVNLHWPRILATERYNGESDSLNARWANATLCHAEKTSLKSLPKDFWADNIISASRWISDRGIEFEYVDSLAVFLQLHILAGLVS